MQSYTGSGNSGYLLSGKILYGTGANKGYWDYQGNDSCVIQALP